jgi:hypothetical protein
MKLKYELEKDKLDWLTSKTTRSNAQTQFLFNLVDGDFEKLKELETQIKNCMLGYCPGDKEEIVTVMNMKWKTNSFNLEK